MTTIKGSSLPLRGWSVRLNGIMFDVRRLQVPLPRPVDDPAEPSRTDVSVVIVPVYTPPAAPDLTFEQVP